MSDRFFIGALSKLSGHSVHTIRWYETQGLIPGVARDGGGRRVYESGHVDHLAFLEHLRRTGMSIADMRKFCELSAQGWRTLEQRQALLRAHRARVEKDIEGLQAALDLIDMKVAYYEEWAAKKKRPPPIHAAKSVRRAPRGQPRGRRSST